MTRLQIITTSLLILMGAGFVSAQKSNDNEINQDSLSFLNFKSEFEQFEKKHGFYIQTNNVKMHYVTWGKPTGTPLVWAHGTGSNAYELLGFADSLVKLGYHVISIDYYGHGFTPIPDKEVSIYHVADDIKFLLDHLKIKKAILGGWSRGGTVATAFYDAYPYRVLGLILEDGGSAPWPVNDHKKPMETFTAETTKMFEEYGAIQAQTFGTELEAAKAWAGGGSPDQNAVFGSLAAVKKLADGKYVFNPGVDELCGASSVESFLTLVYRPFASDKVFGVSTGLMYPRVIYRNLDVPMLILDPVSEKDFFVFEAENTKLQQEHPELITHKVYKDTSHALKYERSDAFLKDVTSFLSTVKRFKAN